MPAPSTPKSTTPSGSGSASSRSPASPGIVWHYRSSAAMLQICVQLSKTHVVSFPDSE